MVWTWSGGPHGSGPAFDLGQAASRTVTWRRTAAATATFDLDGAHRAFGLIVPHITDIWVTCDGVVLHRGRCGPRSGTGTALAATRSFSSVGYRGVLSRRLLAVHNWTATDPVDAAWQLVDDEQHRPGSNLGIIRGLRRPSTAVPTSNAAAGTAVDVAVDAQAALVTGGADWDITPISWLGLQFDFWPAGRGTDRGQTIDLGGRAVSFTDDVADDYANAVRLAGTATAGGVDPGWIWQEAADITTRPEGRWDVAVSCDLTSVAGLLARGPQQLAWAQQVPVAWTCELARGWWNPQTLWIGDPFTWVCKAPGYDVIETQVVETITAVFDQPGEPKVTLGFGAPAHTAAFRRRKVDQALAALTLR